MDEIKNLKPYYKNGVDKIGKDLLKPCLKNCISWRRGTLGFSSSALKSWAGAFVNIVENVDKIEILADISHVNISDRNLMMALEHCSTEDEKQKSLFMHGEQIILKAIKADAVKDRSEFHKDYIWTLLHYLLASEKLEIRFAINTITSGDRNLYHPKGGYFLFPDGEGVAHEGSFNESESGHEFNNETVHVFHKSREEARFWMTADSINEDWTGTPFVKVHRLSKKVLRQIKENAPREFPIPLKTELDIKPININPEKAIKNINIPSIPDKLWGKKFVLRKHQEAAYRGWINQGGNGILWHATGSGKTVTSLYTLSKVVLESEGNGGKCIAIIHVPFTPLADQWVEELLKFNLTAVECYGSSTSWTSKLDYELAKFKQAEAPYVLPLIVIDKTFFMDTFQGYLSSIYEQYPNKIFYICDECHRFAKKGKAKRLPNAKFKMGLSGTPFNSDDGSMIGDIELKNYFGEVCNKYEISEALRDGVLTPYEYIPILCYLDDEELKEVRVWEKKIAQAGFDADGLPNEASNIASGGRNRLLARIEDKFRKLSVLINKTEISSSKEQSLFFVGDGSTEIDIDLGQQSEDQQRVLDKFGKILRDNNWSWSGFTAGESPARRKEIIKDFSEGDIDAMLAIRILDEGIDIPGVMRAFLLASTSNKRQFVQRRGRILRRSDGKDKAIIYDFIVLPPEQEDCGFVNREVQRIISIGRDALEGSKKDSQSLVKKIITSYKIREEIQTEADLYIKE